MNNYNKYIAIILISIWCSCTNDIEPLPVNEEEVISTVRMTLTPIGGGNDIILESRDLDGIGPNDPVISISGNLLANQNYNGNMILLNETINPAENITEEVEEEGEEHQFFYTNTLGLTFTYADLDQAGLPIGILFNLTTGVPGNGNITVILRHEPQKDAAGVAQGELTNAGGESDLEVTFELSVE